MHIKEVIIDGFKSYATRTVISGFDAQFNAITGLNGSGKSNILDAICFVLGLSTLSLARVTSLQELIYKFGHAGVTKASVSITFDNTDKKLSPIGFESYDSIIVTRQISGGKSKYLLNGHNESNQRIRNMFKSVGLNIDNPHFLVAQGRITKVINLRPAELISMLEETAGTSLYNEKKKESLRIIEKKEEKVKEMNDLLKTDIEPQMEKLRKEREVYLQWKSGQIELEKVQRYVRAYEYYEQKKVLEDRRLELASLRSKEQEVQRWLNDNVHKKRKLLEEIEEYRSKRTDNMYENFSELEGQVKLKKKEIADLETELKNLNKNIKESEKEKDAIEGTIAELEASIVRIDQKLIYLDSNIEKQTKQLKERKELYENNERQLKSLLTNKDKVGAEDASFLLEKQIKERETHLSNAESEIKQYETKKRHFEQELEQMKQSVENTIANTKHTQAEIEQLNAEVEKLRKTMDKYDVSQEEYQDLLDEKRKHEEECQFLSRKLDDELQRNSSFKLYFRHPEPNFDTRRVKGRVFHLFSVSDQQFIKALEAIAGGRLYHIVVDNEQTSKLLLKRNSFNGHVNLIPNNKIVSNAIPQEASDRAKQIAQEMGGDAAPAYSLIKYDRELQPTMESVFGGAIICSSTEIAKRIAFDPKIRRKCVNLEGDVFDPSGTLTGGYQNMNASTLTKYNEYKRIENEYNERRHKLKSIDDKCEKYKRTLEEFQGLRNDCDLKVHKLDLLDKKLKGNTSNKSQEKMQSLEDSIKDLKEHIDELVKERQELEAELENLRRDKASTSKGQKSTKDILTEQNEKFKRELNRVQDDLKRNKNEKTNMEVEKEDAEHELARKKKALVDETTTIDKYNKNFDKITKELEKTRKAYYKADEEKRKLDKTISNVDSKVTHNEEQIKHIDQENEDYDKEKKRIEGQMNRYNREVKEAQDSVFNMEKVLPWLVQEYENFGIPGSEFDFERADVEAEKNRFDNLKKYQDSLSKRVNMKVEAMSDKVEKEYKTLLEKRMILETDKHTLNSNIDELDKKKQEALDTCWVAVNKDFGKIFSTLLPGAFAKVEPLPGKPISDGLELKVAFNETWKHSLSELSGGQRSLLALSFMLALLLYKPAPLYILDEIDAALDLSHTQNIGSMISSHFPQSQFIIISLKEGMFNNANVLFKTSFVDGVSRVDRIVLKEKKTGRRNREDAMNVES